MDMIRKNIGMPPDGKKYGCVFIYPKQEDAQPAAQAAKSPRSEPPTPNPAAVYKEFVQQYLSSAENKNTGGS